MNGNEIEIDDQNTRKDEHCVESMLFVKMPTTLLDMRTYSEPARCLVSSSIYNIYHVMSVMIAMEKNSPSQRESERRCVPNDVDVQYDGETLSKISGGTTLTTVLPTNVMIKRLGKRILYEDETLINTILLSLNRPNLIKYFALRTSIGTIFAVIDVIIVLIATIIHPLIPYFGQIVMSLTMFVSFVYWTINCNYLIWKEGIKSFVVWYKNNSLIDCNHSRLYDTLSRSCR